MSDEVRTSGPEAIRECEGAALGVLIWLPAYAGPRLAQLNGYVFTEAPHQVIFESIEALGRTGQVADLANLIGYLTEKGTIERAGGASYLHQIVDMACTNGAYRFVEYVRVIRGNEECRVKNEELRGPGEMTNDQCRMTNGEGVEGQASNDQCQNTNADKSPQDGGEIIESQVSDEDRGRGTSTMTREGS